MNVQEIRLRVALLEAGLQQIDLARQTGLAESTVSRILNAYRAPTTAEKEKIAHALGCAIDALWPQERSVDADA